MLCCAYHSPFTLFNTVRLVSKQDNKPQCPSDICKLCKLFKPAKLNSMLKKSLQYVLRTIG